MAAKYDLTVGAMPGNRLVVRTPISLSAAEILAILEILRTDYPAAQTVGFDETNNEFYFTTTDAASPA